MKLFLTKNVIFIIHGTFLSYIYAALLFNGRSTISSLEEGDLTRIDIQMENMYCYREKRLEMLNYILDSGIESGSGKLTIRDRVHEIGFSGDMDSRKQQKNGG